jgi:hypothetical protein
MFERPHHQKIAKLLGMLDGGFLLEAKCYFGGGTAIALSLDEYLESVDVEFLCSSQEGYRHLRSTATQQSLGRIVGGDAIYSRDVRTDRYAIRVFLEIDEVPVRFKIVREGHLSLQGALDPALGVPVLSRTDLFATKLLANADRFLDDAAYGRDIIDLAMMSSRWGPLPDAAFAKARQAYGSAVDAAFEKAARRMSDPRRLSACMERLGIGAGLAGEIRAAFADIVPGSVESDTLPSDGEAGDGEADGPGHGPK